MSSVNLRYSSMAGLRPALEFLHSAPALFWFHGSSTLICRRRC